MEKNYWSNREIFSFKSKFYALHYHRSQRCFHLMSLTRHWAVLPMLSDGAMPPAATAVAIAHSIVAILILIFVISLFAVSTIDRSLRNDSCSHLLPPLCHLPCHLPPLLLQLPTFDCCYFNFIFLIFSFCCLPLIAHCAMTAVLTSCRRCASMLLPSPWCHLLLLVTTRWLLIITDVFAVTACCAITRATAASATDAVAGAPVSLAVASHHCHKLIVAFCCGSWWHRLLCWHQSHKCFYKHCCQRLFLLL